MVKLKKADLSPEKAAKLEKAFAAYKAHKEREGSAEQNARDVEDDKSYGRAFLLEHRHLHNSESQPIQIQLPEGQVFKAQIRTIHFADYIEIGVLMAREGYSLLDMTSQGAQAIQYASLFFVALAKYDDENQKVFANPAGARAWMYEAGFIEAPLHVLYYILERNPFLKKVFRTEALEILLSVLPE